MYLLELKALSKTYRRGPVPVPVLRGVALAVKPGEFSAIMGPSGSGKSTLLNVLGLLDREYEGSYRFDDLEARILDDDHASSVRNHRIGFIFQAFHLFPHLSVEENVTVPMEYAGRPKRERDRRARELLERVGLGHRLDHVPSQLSGGEQQRVAVARALTNDPPLILADEPTGNLDEQSAQQVMNLLHELREAGKSILMVTHNPALVKALDHVYVMHEGTLREKK